MSTEGETEEQCPAVSDVDPPAPSNAGPPARVDFATFYRERCKERGCRVNSAVAAKLDAASFRPLTALDLNANYVGPKGVLPVLDLLERNQTVELLDLSRNGLDNTAVSALVEVVRRHLGLTELNLSFNNITQAGGKELFTLIETNDRIVSLGLDGTDVYEALLARLDLKVAHNRELHKLQPLMKSTTSRPAQEAFGGPALRKTQQQAPTEVNASVLLDNSAEEVTTSPLVPKAPKERSQRPARPAPPTMASSGYRRMTPEEREQAKADYQERMASQSRPLTEQLRPTVKQSENIGAAAEARRKLEMLEEEDTGTDRVTRPVEGSLDQRALLEQERAEREAEEAEKLRAHAEDRFEEGEAGEEEKEESPEGEEGAGTQKEEAPPGELSAEQQGEPAAPAVESPESAVAAAVAVTEVAAAAEAAEPGLGSAISTADRLAAVLAEDNLADARKAGVANAEPQMAQLQYPEGLDSNGRKFFELFNSGGEAYNAGKMEAAYEAWTEALDFATKSRNREWIAIIDGNIQALSYQLLTLQGDEHLQQGQLEEALNCLQLARNVATKARNCQWERAVDATMNSVRRAQFRDKYSAGAAAFEPLVAAMEGRQAAEEETSVDEGSTAEFAREWPRVNRLRSALQRWAESAVIAHCVTGRGSRELVEMVGLAVQSALNYELTVLLTPQGDIRPAHSAQGTARLASKERTRLLELWGALQVDVLQLNMPLWEAVAASRCGNLQHSLFQNSDAVRSFRKSMQLARTAEHSALEATARTHLGRVYAGLARYSEAEKELLAAETLWETLLHPPDADQEGSEQRVGERDEFVEMKSGGRCPRAYIVEQQVAAYDTLQQVMIGQHRYQDGLEVAERMRAHQHDDKMHEKMRANFDTKATIDHMASIARNSDTVIVLYSVVQRFDWNVDEGRAEAEEQLFIWAVPPEGEMKFVEVGVTRDHRQPSLEPLVDSARAALGVLSDGELRARSEPRSSGVVTDAPSYAWRGPLQKLYDFLIYPISDFLMVSAGVEYVPTRKVTFVPHSFLHLVPWPALMDQQGRYVVEDFNVQVAATVQTLALAHLNGVKLRGEGVPSQSLAVIGMPPDHAAPSLRPFDDELADDSQAVSDALGGTQPLRGEHATKEALMSVLPKCRLLHISSEVLSEARMGPAWGAFGCTDGLFSSADFERLQMHCELAVMQCCNHSLTALHRGGDGVVGMQRALLAAGVPTVIYALWTTPNQSSAALFADFYRLLRDSDKADKAVALSVAQRRCIQQSPYRPSEWGCFCITGVATV
eukprot:Hpha_TRINITY_DN6806_c0_g1::TRINITY_DN6806_c0_g1_i1::g.46172::m.46172